MEQTVKKDLFMYYKKKAFPLREWHGPVVILSRKASSHVIEFQVQ
jgi:hypothetical protein